MISVHLKHESGRITSSGVRLPAHNGLGEINLSRVQILQLAQQLTALVTTPQQPEAFVPCLCSDDSCKSYGCKGERDANTAR